MNKICICGCEMIEVDSHLICSRYFEEIKEMMKILAEKGLEKEIEI